ncbi:hypothetical protein [Xenorhabdus bovienii]|uniref:hypothetical protein n=1 Tax=Xenorhabdus bovienii TaxID=40576 RepID=UPI0023B20DED|nr:hypothetical protein [Xenorhabdus bovienii]MDE9429507.1 hypothetical protein [Xenorhabdus bovienii]MDE9453444.1 hypothetical protein [Xenorhabdus bovienii]MDE9458538.1 hypothetical protein [Xenorhabdus bovienii]MDE9487017.1 hypothetical protein [Xenorhabdus bovienii]MDE9499103.1 hypothetical protein [Xenorhabdus bovienii]
MTNKITVSMDDNSAILIGQIFNLTITFESDNNIPITAGFDLKGFIHISTPITHFDMATGGSKYSATIQMQVDQNIQMGDTVGFDIVPGTTAIGFSKKTIKYKVRDIDTDSLKLYFDHSVITALTKNDGSNIPPKGTSFTLVSTIVKDSKGDFLPNLPVTITGANETDLDNVNIYLSKDNINTEVKKHKLFGMDVIDLTTDEKGKLEFYVYPIFKEQFILKLNTRVLGTTNAEEPKNRLFVIDKDLNTPATDLSIPKLWSPTISEDNDGIITGDDSTTKFHVKIPHYDHADGDDTILFFVDGKYIHQQVQLEHVNNLGRSDFVSLPYAILPKDKEVGFSYTVASALKNIVPSFGLNVKYTGQIRNEPLKNITRIYDMCTVYSSMGYFDPYALVVPNGDINYSVISNHIDNPGNIGLYVTIIGATVPNNQNQVPINSDVTVNLYCNDNTKKFNQTFKGKWQDISINGAKSIKVFIASIPYKYLSHMDNGRIYFDYQVNIAEETSYGKIWQADIDTLLPGWNPGDN